MSLSDKDVRAAKAPADRPFPTLEQVKHVINNFPSLTPIEKRNRALIALITLTGIRDGAVVTLRLKHLDLTGKQPLVIQNPKEVTTKNSKHINAFFLQIGEPFANIVLDWVKFLKNDLFFGESDPLFPKTAMAQDEDACFRPVGLSRHFWADAAPVREIFKRAFESAGLPPYSPHSFRNMLVQVGYQYCKTPEEFKVWSQNLGHESPLTTFTSYGKVSLQRQGEILSKLRMSEAPEEKLDRLMKMMENMQLAQLHGQSSTRRFCPTDNQVRRQGAKTASRLVGANISITPAPNRSASAAR